MKFGLAALSVQPVKAGRYAFNGSIAVIFLVAACQRAHRIAGGRPCWSGIRFRGIRLENELHAHSKTKVPDSRRQTRPSGLLGRVLFAVRAWVIG